jgi:hypothetical protein
MGENLFAFVLMPFDNEFGDTYLLGIKSTVEEFGMQKELTNKYFIEKVY